MLKRAIYCDRNGGMAIHTQPNLEEVEERSFTYLTSEGIPLEMKRYRLSPTSGAGHHRPALLSFFGGSWQKGDMSQFSSHSRFMAARGWVAFTPDYRVSERQGTTPWDSVLDAQAAFRWVVDHAEEHGIHPDQVAACGGSAGGLLAVMAVSAHERHSPCALVLFNPVLDFPQFIARRDPVNARGIDPAIYGYSGITQLYQAISPLARVERRLPPTLVQHGTEDQIVPYTEVLAFAEAMKQQGAVCRVVGYEGRTHGFFNVNRPDYEATLVEASRFLAEQGLPVEGECTR
jgi:acetyl esterase